MATLAQVYAASDAIWARFRSTPPHEVGHPMRDAWDQAARAALEAAEKAPKLDPFPFTYPYKGMVSDGRGRQSMSYVEPYEVAEGIRFEPRPEYSQELEHYVGTTYAKVYYDALEAEG